MKELILSRLLPASLHLHGRLVACIAACHPRKFPHGCRALTIPRTRGTCAPTQWPNPKILPEIPGHVSTSISQPFLRQGSLRIRRHPDLPRKPAQRQKGSGGWQCGAVQGCGKLSPTNVGDDKTKSLQLQGRSAVWSRISSTNQQNFFFGEETTTNSIANRDSWDCSLLKP
jgi:hypothetical protein